MKRILFVGAEAMPFAATGGLGDVLGSLPAAIAAEGDELEVSVIMPLYSVIADEWREKMENVAELEVPLAWRRLYCGIKKLEKDEVTYYFVDIGYIVTVEISVYSVNDLQRSVRIDEVRCSHGDSGRSGEHEFDGVIGIADSSHTDDGDFHRTVGVVHHLDRHRLHRRTGKSAHHVGEFRTSRLNVDSHCAQGVDE